MSSVRMLALVAGAVVGVLVSPLTTLEMASAAQLPVTAAPLQTWKITHGLPAAPRVRADGAADPTGPEADSSADASAASPDSDENPRTPTPDEPAPVDDAAAGQASSGPGHDPTEQPATGAQQPPDADGGVTAPDTNVQHPPEGTLDVGP